MNLKNAISQATQGSVISAPLRDLYQQAFNRPYWSYRKRMKAWFSQFISPGDLVFDVGANVGEYTSAFVSLGARVVAVEPNPKLTQGLKAIRPSGRVTIESVALGKNEGTAELYLCGRDCLASLSREWISIAESSERFSGISWKETTTVPVLTLDTLVKRHGSPQFIKIDVEGFEPDVLAGLSIAPRFLSFEFNSEFVEAAIACVAQNCFHSDTDFNITVGISMDFVYDRWVSRDEIIRYFESPGFAKAKTHGDVIARRC